MKIAPTAEDKWRGVWRFALWLGRAEESDDHLLFLQGTVQRHRCIRRLSLADARRWDGEAVRALRVTPWRLKQAELGDEGRVVQPIGATDSAEASAGRILPLSQRPLTPGCAACARMGQHHGFHHSADCRRRRQAWLDQQLGPPHAELLPEVGARDDPGGGGGQPVEQVRRR